MTDKFSESRRRLLCSTLPAAGIVAMLPRGLYSAELPHVEENDPTAIALKYKHDATESERTNPEAFCHNCRYFRGTQQTEWAPCDLFPGKSVAAQGWCNVWAMRG